MGNILKDDALEAEWVTALTDGSYQQGHGQLVSFDHVSEGNWDVSKPRHCCLGVLCEILAAKGVLQREPLNDGGVVFWDASSSSTGFVPDQWWQDNSTERVSQNSLSSVNDRGATFEQIAAVISGDLDVHDLGRSLP